MNKRQQIVLRVRIGFLLICLIGFAIIARAFYIQTYQGKHYKNLANTFTISNIKLPAERGNIYASDGRLLATTLPIFDLGFDIRTSLATNDSFQKKVDSLALMFSITFKDKTAKQYSHEFRKLRNKGKRYFVVKRNVSYQTRIDMENWPLIRYGQFISGFVFDERKIRSKPFGWLASRTIGYYKKEAAKRTGVGLEIKFDSVLTGIPGNTLAQRVSRKLYIPMDSPENVPPQPGKDLYTTIDIEFQDVAEDALYRALKYHGAEHGSVILMECKTGKIKAVANLGRGKDSIFSESNNYAFAVGEAPGSTFKIATVAALMEDGYVTNETMVNVGDGTAKFYNLTIRDHGTPDHSNISLKEAIEQSSNVAIAKLADKFYNNTAGKEKFYKHLEAFGFTQPIDIEIIGAGKPILRNYDKWQATSIPYLAHGYEMQLTPLHILNFYNAIANGGVMTKPSIVEKITSYDHLVDSFPPVVLNKGLMSKETVSAIREMLEGVVENGTAVNLKTDYLKVAGKTGTAKIAQGKEGYKKAIYQASFCGYFPAENPLYSMIVVVNSPSQNGYYGNKVAGTVFKEVADKVYSKSLKMQVPIQQLVAKNDLPLIQKGLTNNIVDIYALWHKKTNIQRDVEFESWAQVKNDGISINLKEIEINGERVPAVVGMGLSDALYLLETLGLKVTFKGKGVVKSQSVKAGEPIQKDMEILIELS